MIRLTVLYGHPESPDEFDRYYEEVHLPLAKQIKGLDGWTIGKCESVGPGEPPPYYLIVGLYFQSAEAMNECLASPEAQAAIADIPNFATGGAKIMTSQEQVLTPIELT